MMIKYYIIFFPFCQYPKQSLEVVFLAVLRRYTTDCQQAIFERRAENNFIGIDDLREYADDMANGEELIYQNSHMQVELLRCVA